MPGVFPHLVMTTRNVLRYYRSVPPMSLGDSSYVSVLSSCVISRGTCSGSSLLLVTLLEPLKHVISVCGYLFIDDHTTGPKLSIDTNGQDTGEDFPLGKNCPTLKITLRIALYFQGSEILIMSPFSHTKGEQHLSIQRFCLSLV